MARVKTRPQFDKRAAVRKVLEGLDPAVLHDKQLVSAAVKKAGIKVHGTTIGKIRTNMLKGGGASSEQNNSMNEKSIHAVMTAIDRCGGVAQVRVHLALVERIQKGRV